ncbi:MAG: GGDEF domain-containing protein [Lachnospiraceae bacterium]|nr:GGDEF domain-containing protein [Lachnospiraceae bacterium]
MNLKSLFAFLKEDSSNQSPEETANRYALRCMNISILVISFIWILDMLGIFIVDQTITTLAFIISWCIYIPSMLVCRIYGLHKAWIKYFILMWTVFMFAGIHLFLTYHATLALLIPIAFACMYSSRKMLLYTYLLTAFGITISVYGGYYFGLCDANMVLLTTGPISDYIGPEGTFLLTQINNNVAFSVGLFYVFPKILVAGVFTLVCNSVSKIIGMNMARAREMENLADLDGMTEVYNKSKFLRQVESAYGATEKVAVIYWDVNNLKKINDSMGHEYGDQLILTAGKSIKAITTKASTAYRVGGDEFVLIIRGGEEKTIRRKLGEWQKAYNDAVTDAPIELSISYGYAWGKGAELEDIIRRADQMMYENKRAYHLEQDEK